MTKKCSNCQRTVPNVLRDAKFCAFCGTELPKPDLTKEVLGPEYQSTYGVWKVTTEGDVEGRSIRQLGIFKGHIDTIARSLADLSFYSLHFIPTTELDKLPEPSDRTEVSVLLDSQNMGKYNTEERAEIMRDLFKDRPVSVEEGTYYGGFKLVWGEQR